MKKADNDGLGSNGHKNDGGDDVETNKRRKDSQGDRKDRGDSGSSDE